MCVSSPTVVFAFLIAIVFIFSSCNSFLSNQSKSLIALNKAFQNQRPFESRISDFDYAPIKNIRGKNTENFDKTSFDFVKELALKDASENQSAENLHALGRIYLTEKRFDDAIEQFENALETSPNNVKLHNDLGTAFLEKAKNNDDSLKLLANSLEEFSKAIELDKTSKEAYFNKALSIQLMNLPNQTKEAWQEYIELDNSTDWSKEAERNLQSIESKRVKDYSAKELEEEFIKAFKIDDDALALQLVSENRELIQEKYLPQKLAMSYLLAKENERSEKLKVFIYLGKIEKERFGDNYASDLAKLYGEASDREIEFLKQAQSFVKKGYSFCKKGEFSEALTAFYSAKKLFLKANDLIEANTISDHFIAYCLYFTEKKEEALKKFKLIDEFCLERNYKWFHIANFYWINGRNTAIFAYDSITKVKDSYKKRTRYFTRFR